MADRIKHLNNFEGSLKDTERNKSEYKLPNEGYIYEIDI